MDSTVVEKLEEFGLGNFIKEYRFYLCDKTVNQNKIAAALKINDDQRSIINASPDNFSRNQKLYEFIQRKSEVKNFLEALSETGNDHIIKFIKETELSAFDPTFSKNPNWSKSRGIWFNIPEPIDSFCGREDFLVQLHHHLSFHTYGSEVNIVSGLGGVGKTQTVRKYIMKYQQSYNNFIWIEAQSENSIRNSFLKLADELKIPIKNSEGKPRDTEEIVKEIYNKICVGGKSTLIVFDNAEDYQSCKNFFPFGLHPDLTKPVILATSRNQDWILPTGKIQVLPLDKMTEDESLEFISKQLEIPESEIPEFLEESKEFINLIGGLPLALQQAVAYIKQEREGTQILGQSYQISNYILEFKSSARKLQNFHHAPDSSTTVFITWDLTLKKIKKYLKGKIAIQIIEAMSFLYADKVPMDFLLELLPLPPSPPQIWLNLLHNLFQQQPEDFQSKDLVEVLNILERFSMIKITGNFVSVHRQVQFVILQNLKSSDRLPKLFNHLLEKCSKILKYVQVTKSSDIFLNLHQIVNNAVDLTPVTRKFLKFMFEFGLVFHEASRHSEALDIYKKLYNKERELFGGNHRHTLSVQHFIAMNLDQLGRYDEALTLYKEILEKEEIHLGVDYPVTITTKHNMASILRHQKKYGESLELLQQVLAQRNKIHGENHPKTLTTQNGIASLHLDLEDFPQALHLYQNVERKRKEVLGPNHRDVLLTKHNKATVLYKMNKLEEASKIFNEVYERRKETLGKNHLDTIDTLELIALILEKEGKLKEALDSYKKVYDIRKSALGEDHLQTRRVKSNIVNVETKLQEAATSLSEASSSDRDTDNNTATSKAQISTPNDLEVQQQGSLVSQELKPSGGKLESSSSVLGWLVYDSELAIKNKIKNSLNLLCEETVNPVKFAMDLLSFELLDDNRFHELMGHEDDDYVLCYYLYVEVLKLTSLDSVRKALRALNASENSHIVKYILFGQACGLNSTPPTFNHSVDDGGKMERKPDAPSTSTSSAQFSKKNAQGDSYKCENVRVLFINQKFDAVGKSGDKKYAEKKRGGADGDKEHAKKLFKHKLRMKLQVEENVDSDEIHGILTGFQRKCKKDGNDGCIVIISTHGGEEPFSLLMDDLKWIHWKRNVVQHFGPDEFPDFDGKPKIFLFNTSQLERAEVPQESQFSGEDSFSDILIGHLNLPSSTGFPPSGSQVDFSSASIIKLIHDVYLQTPENPKGHKIQDLLHLVEEEAEKVMGETSSAKFPLVKINSSQLFKRFYLKPQTPK